MEGEAVAIRAAEGDRRQLEKVAAKNQLEPSKRDLEIAEYIPADVIEDVEQERVEHGDLIDDQHSRLAPAVARCAVALHLLKQCVT